ncbi:hypothetical protein D3C79_909920 [compost metagenome]
MDITAQRTFLNDNSRNLYILGLRCMLAIIEDQNHADIPGTGNKHNGKLDGI